MSDKPSYLGLLNAISLAETEAHEYLTAWAAVTPHDGVRQTLLTVAAARPTQAPRVSVVEAGGEHIVAIQDGDAIDWIVARGAAEHHAIETDGTIGLCRMSSKGPVEQRHAGGTHVRVDTGALARLLESMCLEAR